ncbi:unnamed protein product [Paramecium sonneborni]|uniref:CSC1/OSCA1-like cytosolic domain-containing protein n=1 Tax=Paramecium sonneborni TaxID=65129 RepID=A0A8S1LKX9_9CILI|nr:unnamed protein product [Paramecium sonneborni]
MFLKSIINDLNLQEEQNDDYEPFRRPPNFELAKNHAKANKFCNSKEIDNIDNIEYCPCCGFPIIESQLSYCCKNEELAFNGAGVPLFFEFMVFVAILLFLNFLISGLYNAMNNYEGIECQINNSVCKINYYNTYSLTNSSRYSFHLKIRKPDSILLGLDVLNILSMIIFSIYYRRHLNITATKIDEKNISISDYSIQVSNLPISSDKQEISNYFSEVKQNGTSVSKLSIVHIVLGYDIQEYYLLTKLKIENELKITSILSEQQNLSMGTQTLNFEQQLEDINSKIQQFQQNPQLFKFSGVAFITYNTSTQAKQIRQYHTQTKFQYILQKLLFFYPLGSTKTFQGKTPHVIRAPEPGDVIWENLGINPLIQFKYQILTNLGSLLILAICFGSILGISVYQDKLNQSDKKNQSTSVELSITVFGLIASFIISILNNIMGLLMKKFVFLELHSTQTEFNISFANKLGIAQFINTAIIPLLVNIVLNDQDILTQTWKDGGLISDVYLVLIMNAIFPWLFNLFDPYHFYRQYRIRKSQNQGQNCALTQREANLLFEGLPGDLSKKYATITKTLMLSFFYAQLIPLGVVISLCFIFINYWVEKYLLVYRYSKGPTIGSQLAAEMVDTYIEFAILLFSIGNCIWQSLLQVEIHFLVWIQLSLGIIQYLFPLDQIFDNFIKVEEPETQSTFEDNQTYIWDDYGKRNPVTMQTEIEQWILQISKRKTNNFSNKKILNYFNRVNKQQQNKDIELQEQVANSVISSKFLKLLMNKRQVYPLNQEFIQKLKTKTKKKHLTENHEQANYTQTINQSLQEFQI